MRLIAVLLAALAALLASAAPACADPITITVSATVFKAISAAAVFINTLTATLAVNALTRVLGLNKQPIAERQASVTTLSMGEGPREALFGVVCTGGWLIDGFNHGGKYKTDWATRCVGVADHFCDGVAGYYVDGVYYAWTGSGVQAGFGGALIIDFVNASAEGAAPPARILTASAEAMAPEPADWTAQDTLASVSHFWVSTKFDDKIWTQGHPTIQFVMRGLRLYDPRKDAQLGYTGPNPHVWADPSTHEFSRNAVVGAYNYRRGIFATGRHGQSQHLLVGRGLSAIEAPPDRIIAAANVCDEPVLGRIRYAADGLVYSNQPFVEVEGLFASACAGIVVQREGGVEIEPGQAKAVVATIRDGDLVDGEPETYSPFLPDTDGGRINTVVPRYVEPAQNWKDHSGTVRRSLTDIAADGGPRELTLSLPLVTVAEQADACALIAQHKARLEKRASLVLPPQYAELEEGDWIARQSNRRFNGGTVRYRIVSWSLDEMWRQHLALEEIASSVYGQEDPDPGQSQVPPSPQVIDALALTGVIAEGIMLPGENSAIPAIRFRWDVPLDAAIGGIRAEVRVNNTTEIAPTRIDEPGTGLAIITNGVAAGQLLQARLVPIGAPHRPVAPSAWANVATGELIAGDLAPGAPTAVLAAQHTDLIAAEMLRGALYRSYTDGLLYLEGQPVATLFQSLSEQVTDELGSFAGTLNLLGAKNEAGTGFIIAADQVFLPAADTGGQVTSLRGLQLTTATNTQSISQLFSVTDRFVESKTLLVVNDVVTGIVNQNDGTVGSLQFQADVFAFVDPNSGIRTVPFSYGLDNILRLTNTIIHGDLVVTGTLTNRALVKNTITGLAVADTTGVVTLTGTTAKQVQSVWIEVKGENTPVKLLFNGLVLMLHNPSGSFSATFEFRRASDNGAGIALRSRTVDATGDTYDAVSGSYVFTLNDVPGPGIWRYFVTARSSASNMTVQQITDPYMEAVEYRTNAA